jgi:hypothetical protein
MTEVLYRPPSPDRSPAEQENDKTALAAQTPETLRESKIPAMSPVPLSELLTRKEQRRRSREERRAKPGYTRRKIGVTALCLATSLGLAYEGFMFDQNTLANMVWGSDKADFHTLYEHSDGGMTPETYVYVIPGTGIKDATPRVATPLMPSFSSIPNVKYMSLKEGAHPQINDTHTALDQTIDKESPPDRVIFEGMSAGGKESLDLAAYIREKYPEIDISIILSSSPYDQDSAYQLRGSDNVLPVIADLSAELNLRGGPITRFFGEMYNKRDHCWDDDDIFFKQCYETAKQVARGKLTSDSSSTELLEWQVEWTRTLSAGRNIGALKNEDDKGRTSILYIETTKDTIVDDEQAIGKYEADADKNDIPFEVIAIDTPHASENANAKIYNKKVISKYLAEIDDIYAQIDEQNLVNKALDSKIEPNQVSTSPTPSRIPNIAAR